MISEHFKQTRMIMAACIIMSLPLSCIKNSDRSNCGLDAGNLSGTYRLVSLVYKADANAMPQDYAAYFSNCKKDDLIRLNINGTLDYIDAGVLCSPPGNYSGNWALRSYTFMSDGLMNGDIEHFDCHGLVTVRRNLYMSGDELKLTMRKI